ncbi:MAG: hypothetical protein O7G86_01465, partial [Gammaproteobacteria bacterium]|nr:hypothetical protein [Gammaproteobacteria bacterium]
MDFGFAMTTHDTTARVTPSVLCNWRHPRSVTFATLAAFVIVSGLLASMVSSPREVTQIRHSLVADVGKLDEFDWGPDALPVDFMAECGTPPPEFVETAATVAAILAVVLLVQIRLRIRSGTRSSHRYRATKVRSFKLAFWIICVVLVNRHTSAQTV